VAFDLAPCTLITGANASGKSALIDAISLALTGESRSEGLRKDVRLLLRLAPPGPPGVTQRELYSRARLSDGTEASFRIDGKQPEWITGVEAKGPRGVIITDIARALLYGDAKALMQAVASSTRATIFRDALENEVTRGVFPLFNEIWTEDCKLDGKLERTVGEVQTALVATQARIKAAKAIKRSAKTGEALITPLSEEDEGELQAASRVIAALRPGQALDAMLRELADLPPFNPVEYEKLLDRHALVEHVVEVLAILDRRVAKPNFHCPCCARGGMTREHVTRRQQAVRAGQELAIAAVEEREAVQQRHMLYGAANLFASRGLSAGDLQAHRAELLRRKEAAASEPTRNAVKAVTDEEINQLELIQAVCVEAIKNATDQQLGTVERRINRALPAHYRAKVISEGGYRLELVTPKDDVARDFRALSGAERTLLLSAFASATIPDGAPPVRLLVVDEAWLDPKSMKALLKSLPKVVGSEAGPTQAIVCAVAYKSKAIDGWAEVKLATQDDGGGDDV
jgi:energy-coupling factor transporter ATP-binding protein EcfA2